MLAAAMQPRKEIDAEVVAKVSRVKEEIAALSKRVEELSGMVGVGEGKQTALDIFHGYLGVFAVAFVELKFASAAVWTVQRLPVRNGTTKNPFRCTRYAPISITAPQKL